MNGGASGVSLTQLQQENEDLRQENIRLEVHKHWFVKIENGDTFRGGSSFQIDYYLPSEKLPLPPF